MSRAVGSALLIALFLVALILPAGAQTVSQYHRSYGGTDYLYADQRLMPGEILSSPNGMYELGMQSDGNLVIYRVTSSVSPIWASNTDRFPGAFLRNQGDGSLVIYAVNPVRPVWASNTMGRGTANLFMQNDGNLALYASGNRPT